MPVTVEFFENIPFVWIRFEGPSTYQDLHELTLHAHELATAHGCYNFLMDASRLDLVTALAHEIFDIPELYGSLGFPHTVRVALVMPAGERERDKASFYSTVCNNRGYLVVTFEDAGTAMAWLVAKPQEGVP